MRPALLLALLLAPAWAAPAEDAAPAAPDAGQVAALVRQLGARYLDDRQKAKEALERLGAPAAEPPLLKALGDEDVRIRRAACEILGRFRSAAAAPRLVDLLQDPDEYVQEAAREALVRIGPPAHDAIRQAQQAGRLTAEQVHDLIKRMVEEALNRCISRNLGYGYFKDQFKDIIALGPPATRVLVRLFTTPPAEYEFSCEFSEQETLGGVDEILARRKMIVQHLAGEALAEMNDRSVVPALKAFVEKLENQPGFDLLAETERQQDYFYETAASALRRLGEPAAYEKILKAFREAAGVEAGAAGAPALKPLPSDNGPQLRRRFDSLSRLAMFLVKNGDAPGSVWVYQQIVEKAPAEIERLSKADAGAAPDRVTAADVRSVLRGAQYNLACAYALLGRKAEAVASLKEAVENGYGDAEWIKKDGDLDAIRKEPEYRALIRKLERRGRPDVELLIEDH